MVTVDRALIQQASGHARSVRDVLDLARATLGVDAALFWARRQHSLRTQAASIRGHDARKDPIRVDLGIGEGAAGRCAEAREPLVIADLNDAEELASKGIESIVHLGVVERFGWKSAAYWPMVFDNRILGVLAAYSVQEDATSEEMFPLLELFSERVAIRMKLSDLNTRYERMVRIGAAAMTRAHDIREEAGAIQTNLDAVKKRLGSSSRDEIFEMLDTTKALARNCQELMDQTLRQVVDDRAKPRLTPLEPVIQSVVNDRMTGAALARIDLSVDCESTLAAVCWERELARALRNLIDNAVYFLRYYETTIEKRIRVEAFILRDVDGNPTSTCCIQVKDSGPGIPPEERYRVFEFGYTGKGARGMGIGLSYVESVVEACGGYIEVGDDKEFSTIFSLTLAGRTRE